MLQQKIKSCLRAHEQVLKASFLTLWPTVTQEHFGPHIEVFVLTSCIPGILLIAFLSDVSIATSENFLSTNDFIVSAKLEQDIYARTRS